MLQESGWEGGLRGGSFVRCRRKTGRQAGARSRGGIKVFAGGDKAGRCRVKDGEGVGRRKTLNREKAANERTGKLTRGRSTEHRKEQGVFLKTCTENRRQKMADDCRESGCWKEKR